jgi:hypothetical protein
VEELETLDQEAAETSVSLKKILQALTM